MNAIALRRTVRHNAVPLLSGLIFLAMFALYLALQPRGVTVGVLVTAANKGVLLALIAIAQTFVVLTGGIDLSVGAIVVLANCLASTMLSGSPAHLGLGVLATIACGLVAGGDIDDDFASALTGDVAGIPVSILLLAVVLLGFWLPFQRSITGRGIYAVGSAEAS